MHKPNQITVYDCVCSKCAYPWQTKNEKLPKACPKCARVTWDDDYKSLAEVLGKDSTPSDAPIEKAVTETLTVSPTTQRVELDALQAYVAGKLPAEAIVVLPEADVSTVEEEPEEPASPPKPIDRQQMIDNALAKLRTKPKQTALNQLEPTVSEPTVISNPPDNPFATPPLTEREKELILEQQEADRIDTSGDLDQTKKHVPATR